MPFCRVLKQSAKPDKRQAMLSAEDKNFTAQGEGAQPLSGVRVLDLTHLAVGPLATQILGDMGADVIKVEPANGEIFRHNMPQRSHGMGHIFLQLNRNKRSLALDLKSDHGRETMRRLLATSDVFVANYRAAALKKLGLDYEAVKAINPQIVYCVSYGYSEKGPYAGRPSNDDTTQAASGLSWLMREAAGTDTLIPSVIADKAVGMTLAYAILGAIVHRLRSGMGQFVEVPMFESMVAFVMPEHVSGQSFDPPLGPPGYSRIINSYRRVFATKDGRLCIHPYTTEQWIRFFRLVGREDMANDRAYIDPAERSRRYMELYKFIEEVAPSRTSAEWIAALSENDILFSDVKSLQDLMEDPQLAASEMFRIVDHPTEGKLRLLGWPVSYSETPNTIRHLPPNVGEHNAEILRELGLTDSEQPSGGRPITSDAF
jgi:crotonobetainyl-CoA:carnitine CoA-transferase CaiB-like acyl-CoA transferase